MCVVVFWWCFGNGLMVRLDIHVRGGVLVVV